MASSAGRKPSAAKRSGSRKSGSSRKRSGSRSRQQERIDVAVRDEVILWLGFAVTILLFLCNFHLIGKAGDAVSSVMFGLFGVLAYIFPLVAFFGSVFVVVNLGKPVVVIKEISAVIMFLVLEVLFAMIGGLDKIGNSAKEYYGFAKEHIVSGGLLGGGIAKWMAGGIGNVGCITISVILFLVTFVLITERSILRGLQKTGRRMFDNMHEDMEYRMQRNDRRSEERQERSRARKERVADRLREDEEKRERKKVKGVTFDTTLTQQEEAGESEADIAQNEAENTEEMKELQMAEDLEKIRIKGLDTETEESAAEESRGGLADAVVRAAEMEEITEDLPGASANKKKHKIELKDRITPQEEQSDMRSIEEALEEEADRLLAPERKEETAPVETAVPKPKKKPYKQPPLNLLSLPGGKKNVSSDQELRQTALMLTQTLDTFKVKAKVTDISRGPAVTRFELQPEPGVKVSKIVSLSDDIKLALAATDIRIEAPIPGKSAVGIEVPNKENTMVSLRELLESGEFKRNDSKLSFAVGRDIAGQVMVTDIAKMPHMLIAGSTGSGKSVCINTLIMSILYKARPEEVKLILIDPKVVELSVYNGIPHLLLPVVTDPKKAAAALQWGVNEMMDRYKKFEEQGVRDLKGYNRKMEELTTNDGQPMDKLPQIVIVVDELADLMMVAPGDVEEAICRIAQLARAAGIHLVIATQRPSVDVITGLIKANMPSRIAFAVSSGVDSRTILDMVGAEKLLGKGDMLFYPQGIPKPVRVQGAFVSDKEVAAVVDFLKEHSGTDGEDENEVMKQMEAIGSGDSGTDGQSSFEERDELFAKAGRFIIEKDKASIGMLQRVFKIGFNRAARIMDQLADYGVVGPEEGTKARKILMGPDEFERLLEEI
ncbi:MAG: DNA translocase FtsK [Lachnospiraceae bacterium]|nr:DNA translocase FtsK [Lachnospiraceae bacterium]